MRQERMTESQATTLEVLFTLTLYRSSLNWVKTVG